VVLVLASSQLDGFAVEEKSSLCVKLDGTDTEDGFVAIEASRRPALQSEVVKVAIFKRP
jgi:hypothetical protein